MKLVTCHLSLVTSLIALTLTPLAYADIGGIGSPVVPSNPPADDPYSNQGYQAVAPTPPLQAPPGYQNVPALQPPAQAAPQLQGYQNAMPAPQAPAQAAPLTTPQVLLVLRFAYPHAFDRDVREAIETAQRNKPDTFYQVVSYIPHKPGTNPTQQDVDDAAGNLALLTRQMQQLGVPNNKMQFDIEFSGLVSYQEIRIFAY